MTVRRLLLLGLLCSALLGAKDPGRADWEREVEYFGAAEFRKAQLAFESAVEADPERSEYHLWLGLAVWRRSARLMTGQKVLGAMGFGRRSRLQFERAVELDGSNLLAPEALHGFHLRAPVSVGGSKDRARRISGLIEEFDRARGASAEVRIARARKLAPDEIRPLLLHAGVLARRGRHAESDDLFDAAFEREPGNPEVWLAAGKAWAEAKRKSKCERARALLERYLPSPDRDPASLSPIAVRKILRTL